MSPRHLARPRTWLRSMRSLALGAGHTHWHPAFSRDIPHERYRTSVPERDHQFHLIRSQHETARILAGFVLLAMALTPWRSPGSSESVGFVAITGRLVRAATVPRRAICCREQMQRTIL